MRKKYNEEPSLTELYGVGLDYNNYSLNNSNAITNKTTVPRNKKISNVINTVADTTNQLMPAVTNLINTIKKGKNNSYVPAYNTPKQKNIDPLVFAIPAFGLVAFYLLQKNKKKRK